MNTIEQNLTSIAASLAFIAQALHAQTGNAQSTQFAPPATAPVSQAPAFAAPVVAPVVATPVFTPPATVAAPAPGACPIVDQKTLVEYVMDAYKTLGPQKGAAIQGVLNNCQVQSINECRPEHYAYIHQCVEQLKAS